MKYIAYLIVDNGMDGKAPEKVMGAFSSEPERNEFIDAHYKNAPYWRTKEIIVDSVDDRAVALSKLTTLDKFILGIK